MKSLSMFAALTAVGLFAGSLQAEDFEVAGMKAPLPAKWKKEAPSNEMRVGQYKLPKAEGDDSDAELVVFYFKGGSGTVQQNLDRQLAKFKGKDGGKPEAKVEKSKVGGLDATYQDITGTYLSKFPPFAPNAKITEKPNYRQIYVLFQKDGDYYMTLLGPAKTVESHKKDFDEVLKNLK